MRTTSPTEYEECVTLAEYLELLKNQGKIICYSHIPNETFTKSWAVKVKNKKQGVHKGVPDYLIVTKDTVLFIEMKRTDKSKTSPEQVKWLSALKDKKTASGVAKGFDEAKLILDTLI